MRPIRNSDELSVDRNSFHTPFARKEKCIRTPEQIHLHPMEPTVLRVVCLHENRIESGERAMLRANPFLFLHRCRRQNGWCLHPFLVWKYDMRRGWVSEAWPTKPKNEHYGMKNEHAAWCCISSFIFHFTFAENPKVCWLQVGCRCAGFRWHA